MRGVSRTRMVVVLGALIGLVVFARLPAEDKPAKETKSDPPAAVAKTVTPMPLIDQIKKWLAYLVALQQEDGGWSQGGGWRVGGQGGARAEGKDVADPSDVGNTAIALLALIRAGNTPTEGQYAKNVAKGIKYIRGKVEKA